MNVLKSVSTSSPTAGPPGYKPSPYWVVCLCAGWCGLCTDYVKVFEKVALDKDQRFPLAQFAWLDIEDEADWLGDLDIETFPTMLVADQHGMLFMGSLMPHAETLARLLLALQGADARRLPHTVLSKMLVDELPGRPAFWVRPHKTA